MAVGCLLALLSAALWGRYAAAQKDDVELLQPETNWSPAQHISTTSVNGAFVPVLRASSTGRLMIMYNHETADEVENPFYSQSNNGGETWSTPEPVHSSDANAQQVAFDFAGNTGHAVWRTLESVWHAREDQWATNGSTLIVDAGERVLDPEIAAGPNGVIHVVWTQLDGNLYYSLSRNGGAQWSAPQALTTGSNRHSVPRIAVDQNGNVHVVWEERIPNPNPPPIFNYAINYIKGNVTNSSVNWQPSQRIAESPDAPGEPRQPTIIADGNDLHVGFSRRLEGDEQYPYYIGYSPGTGWDNQMNTSPGNPVEVNTTTPFYLVSTVAACSEAVHLYYHGAVDPNPREQVLGASYKGTWSSRTAATEPDIRAIYPSMDCQGATLHLAYTEIISTIDANHQVYYVSLSPTVYMPTIHKP